MSRSVELIVEGYVRLNDRDALEDILAHRQDLLRQLVAVTGVDPQRSIAQVSEEITIIEAGLATLVPEYPSWQIALRPTACSAQKA